MTKEDISRDSDYSSQGACGWNLLDGMGIRNTFAHQSGGSPGTVRTEHQVQLNGDAINDVTFEYDLANRIHYVNKSGGRAEFAYHPITGQVTTTTDQVDTTGGGSWATRLSATRDYDRLGRLNGIFWSTTAAVSADQYEYDIYGRRINRYGGPSGKDENWSFGYDDIGQLTSAAATFAAVPNDPIPGAQFTYGFDDIGKPGDLWLLGDRDHGHRLLCGDSTKPEDVDRLMDGEKAALVATDPPYLVDYTGERPNDSGKDWTATYKEVEITDADRFFRGVFANVLRVIAPHAAIYCWHAHKRQRLIADIWHELGILDHQQIVWVKPTPVFGRVFWHFRHEPCMMGWVQGSQPEHDSDHEFNSVWEIDWEGKARIVGNSHPTQKPVEIFARPMRKHTRRGAICFEPFSGSGSQLIAAEKEGRRCLAMELEPAFVDVALSRWALFTSKDPVLERTGETFSALKARQDTAAAVPAGTPA